MSLASLAMWNETNDTFSYFQTLCEVCPKFNHEDQEKTAYFLVVLKFLVKMETFSYKSVIGDKVECSRTPACNLENRRFYNVCRQLVISQAIHNAKEHKRQSTIGCFISIYAFGKPTKYDDSNNLGQYHQVHSV